uniref:Uncharacterized protein n=1 Tax=Aegilops tauschii subsp. strangulata TaxID=200361 RepID=A0A453RVE4_AEGTS
MTPRTTTSLAVFQTPLYTEVCSTCRPRDSKITEPKSSSCLPKHSWNSSFFL